MKFSPPWTTSGKENLSLRDCEERVAVYIPTGRQWVLDSLSAIEKLSCNPPVPLMSITIVKPSMFVIVAQSLATGRGVAVGVGTGVGSISTRVEQG